MRLNKTKERTMEKMRFFMDTHDKEQETFPAGITPTEFKEFYKAYEKACLEEGVISIKIHAGFKQGKAFCLNMAPSAEAVFKVHEKVGLPYNDITEIMTISPSDLINI